MKNPSHLYHCHWNMFTRTNWNSKGKVRLTGVKIQIWLWAIKGKKKSDSSERKKISDLAKSGEKNQWEKKEMKIK